MGEGEKATLMAQRENHHVNGKRIEFEEEEK
jgi:hypothetical protein